MKHIVIAGASSGIGAALVSALAAESHLLYVCARRADRLATVTERDQIARSRVCDVADEDQVIAFLRWVERHTASLDAVINCAGGFGAVGPVETTPTEAWLQTIRVNLFGTYLVTKHALPLLERSGDPRVINFAGGGAFNPFPNYSAYATSKAAVVRLTECLAVELAPKGIAVNAVAPGFVATEIHEATLCAGPERAGAEHYARTHDLMSRGSVAMETPVACVKFLLSDGARGLTGKTLSASFDPWQAPEFRASIAQINESDVYTLRRMNLVNLPEGPARAALDGVARAVKRAASVAG